MPRLRLRTIVHAVLLGSLANAGSAGARADACKASTQAMLRSCRAEVQSEKGLAAGRCANSASAAAAKACQHQASGEVKDARGTCRDQHESRGAACKRLGAAAYTPAIDPSKFSTTIDNPLLPLVPGTTFVYEGQTADGLEHNEVAVTHVTRTILGVTCVEVHDTVLVAGTLVEDTLDWFAQDADGNVWYFGENSTQLENGLVVGTEGSWTAGVDGAQPGIVMEAHPAVGDFYRQEFLLGTAEDLAEVSSMDESVAVPAGSFAHCLETLETSPLEPDARENKFYATGVGTVLEIDLETGERLELLQVLAE